MMPSLSSKLVRVVLGAGSQSPGARSLAGIMKTSTCVLHVMDREGCRQTSTCGFQLTVRGGFCRFFSSCPDGRTELLFRRKRDKSFDMLVLLLVLLGLRGLGGICRNQATTLMLCASARGDLKLRTSLPAVVGGNERRREASRDGKRASCSDEWCGIVYRGIVQLLRCSSTLLVRMVGDGSW